MIRRMMAPMISLSQDAVFVFEIILTSF